MLLDIVRYAATPLGDYNVAFGGNALYGTTTGSESVAFEFATHYFQTYRRAQNTAMGYQALYKNTTGKRNTAIGYKSLH